MIGTSLTLHATNRCIERSVPIEVLSVLPIVTPLLTDKPLKVKFREAGITLVARITEDGRPRLVSAWKNT